MADSLLVAQISDTHLFADPSRTMWGQHTNPHFYQVLGCLQQLPRCPDLLLLTGDLSQDDSPESYEEIHRALARLNIPAYWVPGNHDQNLDALGSILSQPPGNPAKSFQSGGWQFILLATLLPQQVQGGLSPESLTWLEQQLQSNAQYPTAIAMHHPALSIDSAWMDCIGVENAAEFLAIIDRYPQVKLVLNGHIHQEFDQVRQGVRFLGTPSTCVQFEPKAVEFVVDDDALPGFRLVELWANGHHSTSVIRIPSKSLSVATGVTALATEMATEQSPLLKS